MMGNKAWQRHGCYHLGSEQYFNFPLQKATMGCHDDWNSLDHFDPSTDSFRLFKHFLHLRSNFPVLQDGFGLNQLGNWTYYIQRPGSNQTETEMGLWTVERKALDSQTLTGSSEVMLLYMNENSTETYKGFCTDSTNGMTTPWGSGTTLRNLIYPYDQVKLIDSKLPFGDGFRGCISSVDMPPFGFKVYVPQNEWVAPLPMITRFLPGHDARIQAESGDTNATTVDIEIQFNIPMDCDSVTSSISFDLASSGHGSAPTLNKNAVKCLTMTGAPESDIVGVEPSGWSWATTLTNVPDGVLRVTVTNPMMQGGTSTTNVSSPCCLFLLHARLADVYWTECRRPTICCSERAHRRTSWCSPSRTTTRACSRHLATRTRSRTTLTAPTSSVIHGTSGQTGRSGRIGRTPRPSRSPSSRAATISGKAITSLRNVSLMEFSFLFSTDNCL